VSRGIAVSFHDLGTYGGGWSAPRPGRFIPGKDPVPIAQEAGWAPGPVWTGVSCHIINVIVIMMMMIIIIRIIIIIIIHGALTVSNKAGSLV
jgi:hypothetical protein